MKNYNWKGENNYLFSNFLSKSVSVQASQNLILIKICLEKDRYTVDRRVFELIFCFGFCGKQTFFKRKRQRQKSEKEICRMLLRVHLLRILVLLKYAASVVVANQYKKDYGYNSEKTKKQIVSTSRKILN